ncbi:MAG: GNAT family N-acetyltransferase [Chloroflexi bacterium]|nr:GNAT family N-acetyltransferase [Chloroflexota bacterium]
MRAIHFDSFLPSERGNFDEWLAEIFGGEKRLYTATIDDALVGYATLLPNIAPQVYFLEYLAVSREHRNAGIGGQLLRHLARELRGKANGLIWEAESDEIGWAKEGAAQRVSRAQWRNITRRETERVAAELAERDGDERALIEEARALVMERMGRNEA